MLPMAAIIAAYPFQVAQGRVFEWLRGLMQGLWLVIPALLIGGLLVAQRRFPEQLTTLTSILDHSRRAASHCPGGACTDRAGGRKRWPFARSWRCGRSTFWCSNRSNADSTTRRTFSRAAFALVQKDPAPLVLHAMGKDAKAIKFMVNIEQDLQPVFTESTQELESLQRASVVDDG